MSVDDAQTQRISIAKSADSTESGHNTAQKKRE